MAVRRKGISIPRVVSYAIVCCAVAAKAFASAIVPLFTVQPHEEPAVWPNVRSEFEEPDAEQSLNRDLVEFVRNATFGDEFELTIRLTYSMISISDAAALDGLWIDTLVRESDADTIAVFMAVRSSIDDFALRNQEDYLENYVWRVANIGSSTGT